MKIWYINNYNMLPEHGTLNRGYYLGKYLKQLGEEPVVFVGSHPHNTNLQLIEGSEKFKIYQEDPFPWVLIKTRNYESSKKSRVVSMFEFYHNMKKASSHFEKPDAIIGSSAHPLAALLAIQLGKKYDCKKIVEIRDLWPESIVAYGIAGPKNPAVIILRKLEKWLYVHADAVIFTMEGAYDYILEQGWEKDIPREKVFFVNNGVDLDLFNYNREHYQIYDEDLKNPDIFKVVYVGAIKKVNNLGRLIDAAKLVRNKRVKFLIWGDGDELKALEKRVLDENVDNVAFRGRVEKKYIPYLTSCSDLNLMHGGETNPAAKKRSKLGNYGISPNKLFDYFAAGKPILTTFNTPYNPASKYDLGDIVEDESSAGIAGLIDMYAIMPPAELEDKGKNARLAAKDYDFKKLTKKLLDIIQLA